MNLREAIAAAVNEPDLDKALLPVQAALGQTDGGPAGMFFSGGEANAETWPQMAPGARRMTMCEYVRFEMFYLEA